MSWIFLSPHFDDAAYSCGGLIWDLTRAGQRVEILTVCSGEPPPEALTPYARSLHERWGVAGAEVTAARSAEDVRACQLLGAARRTLGVPDCIYRRLPDGSPLVEKEEDLWQPLPSEETALVEWVADAISREIEAGARVISPAGVGGHVDHKLTRKAAEWIRGGGRRIRLGYYADFPYVLRESGNSSEIEGAWRPEIFPVPDLALEKWGEAIALYGSQFSSFWKDAAEMQGQLAGYRTETGGCRLYWAA